MDIRQLIPDGYGVDTPAPPSMLLGALRLMPSFRGKQRIARELLSDAQRQRCTAVCDRYGNQIVVPNLVEPVGFALAVDGAYEPALIDLLRREVTPDRDFVDVGANIGTFTLALAGHARRVISIEASPTVLPFLLKNVALSGRSNIDVLGLAVAAPEMESVPFYVPPMASYGMGSSAPQFNVQPVAVKASTLDRILKDVGAGSVGVVKIDVEGFEAHVFLGSPELLGAAQPPVIVFEFCDWAEDRAFPGRKGWAQEILIEAGYKLWSLHDRGKDLEPIKKPLTQGFHSIYARKS